MEAAVGEFHTDFMARTGVRFSRACFRWLDAKVPRRKPSFLGRHCLRVEAQPDNPFWPKHRQPDDRDQRDQTDRVDEDYCASYHFILAKASAAFRCRAPSRLPCQSTIRAAHLMQSPKPSSADQARKARH